MKVNPIYFINICGVVSSIHPSWDEAEAALNKMCEEETSEDCYSAKEYGNVNYIPVGTQIEKIGNGWIINGSLYQGELPDWVILES